MASDQIEPHQDHSAPTSEAAGQGCSKDDLRERLEYIAGQIGDADRRHSDALNDLQERLGRLSQQAEATRAGLPEDCADAFARMERGMEALVQQLASRPARAGAAEETWDAASAEALMRHHESGEADPRQFAGGRRPHHRRSGRVAAALESAQAYAPSAPASPLADRAWLEASLARIAQDVQASLADMASARALTALDARLERLEARFTGALQNVALRADVEGLRAIETQVAELAAHADQASRQLACLVAIDDQLAALRHRIEAQQPHTGATLASAPGDGDLESLIDSAAERAAARLAAALPAAADAHTRLDALEGLLKDSISERRRTEEHTGSILGTMEDALVRIADRFDAIEAAKVPAEVPGKDERDVLAEAYAHGARALAPRQPSATLSAADYLPIPRAVPSPAAPAARTGPTFPQPDGEEERAPAESGVAAMRSKLKAEAGRLTAAAEARADAHAAAVAAAPDGRRALRQAGNPRPLFLFGAALLLLFGAGYLVVDVLLGKTPQAPQGLAVPATKPGHAVAVPNIQHSEAPPVAEGVKPEALPADPQDGPAQPVPAPAPRRRHVPETVTDDLSHNRAPAAGDRDQPKIAALAGGQDDAAAAAPQPALPPAIGPAQLRAAAIGGDPAAAFEVAARYADGKGIAQDFKQAAAWYQRAAMRGHAPAQYRLAGCLQRGLGVDADLERAKVWYARAAAQGHVRAMHNLGVLSAGDPAKADYAAAARWFGMAAEQGLTDSQFNLALLYESGAGVAKDAGAAYKWFALAARHGDQQAVRRLASLKAQLAPSVLDSAQAQVARWLAHASAKGAVAAEHARAD